MVVFDASVLCIAIYPDAGIPTDFRTGEPIGYAKERIDGLISECDRIGETILVPTPALSEVLVVAAPDVQRYLDELNSQKCFKVVPFGQRAAVEIALRIKESIKKEGKKEGIRSEWDKIKYDRQIVAIAKVEGASAIYSADKDVHEHGKLWGIKVLNISDLDVPAKQERLYEEKTTNTAKPPSSEIRGSDFGRIEGQTRGETEEKKEAQED